MSLPLDPAHQALHEEARCWPWRRGLILDRLCELKNVSDATEQALAGYHGDGVICGAVIHLRDLIVDAYRTLDCDELDYTEIACERAEHALIALRGSARELGAVS